MATGKRKGLYAVAGVVTTRTGNKVVAGRTGHGMGARQGQAALHVVDSRTARDFDARRAGPVAAYGDVGDVDWSQLWPYGGEAA